MARKNSPKTYCIATFYLKGKNGEAQVVDENAILVKLDESNIEIVSKYKLKTKLIQSITMSIVDGRNSYLVINGKVLKTANSENGFSYLIETPQKMTKQLPNGMILDIECLPVTKYCNIHKPKRKKKEKTKEIEEASNQ